MMAGYLFARSGVSVTVLEKHADFFRDFRGDTVHPSTMEILDQLGLLGSFLERPHDRLTGVQGRIAGVDYTIGDLSHLDTPAPFIAMISCAMRRSSCQRSRSRWKLTPRRSLRRAAALWALGWPTGANSVHASW
jgi:2-polyprenyl-6-methoxyphenol hydroxylase-like FAD-dependent oxidoreductase